jgi:hypothetical protein
MPKRKTGFEKVYKHGKIYKYDKKGNFIAEYDSLAIACDLNGKHVDDVIRGGRTKYVKGFYFSYEYHIKFPKERLPVLRQKGVHNKIKVYQYHLNGIFIKEWESATKAHQELNINRAQINKASKSNFKNKAGSFLWTRIFIKKAPKYIRGTHKRAKIVEQYDLKGKLISTFKSAREAMRQTKITSIPNCLINNQKSAGGFIWKYK